MYTYVVSYKDPALLGSLLLKSIANSLAITLSHYMASYRDLQEGHTYGY